MEAILVQWSPNQDPRAGPQFGQSIDAQLWTAYHLVIEAACVRRRQAPWDRVYRDFLCVGDHDSGAPTLTSGLHCGSEGAKKVLR